MSLPQIVIDAEIAAMICRLLGETEISPADDDGRRHSRVGFKGEYLKEKETARRVRLGEQFMPAIATRLSLEAWQAAGQDELSVASQRVREILAAADERGPVLAADAMARLESVVDEAAAGTGRA